MKSHRLFSHHSLTPELVDEKILVTPKSSVSPIISSTESDEKISTPITDFSNIEADDYHAPARLEDLEIDYVPLVNEEDIPSVPTCRAQLNFYLAVFVIYFMADGCWQEMDNLLGNDDFNHYSVLAYPLRCTVVGVAQVGGGFVGNALSAFFKVMPLWNRWDVLTYFVTGMQWLPLVDLGTKLGGLMTDDPDAVVAVMINSAVLAVGNLATLYFLIFLQNYLQGKSGTASLRVQPSFAADIAANIGFYLQGPLPEPRSASGMRSVGWAAFFSAGSAVAGQAFTQVKNFFKGSGSAQSDRLQLSSARQAIN